MSKQASKNKVAAREEFKRRVLYRRDWTGWICDTFEVDRKTIVWSENEGYEASGRVKPPSDRTMPPGWGGWDGTPDPIHRALKELGEGNWVGCESSTATGKTWTAAKICQAFLDLYHEGFVITVAPKEDQLRKNMWKEVGRDWETFKGLREEADKNDLALYVNAKAKDRDAWAAFGYSAGVGAEEEAATRMQGFHAPHMLFIVEECAGVNEAVMNAIINTSVGDHNLIFAIGNPDSENDTLHKFCMRSDVVHIRISALDHPNVVCRNPEIVPGAVTVRSIVTRLQNDPINGDQSHPLYLSRVRGICPAASGHCLFPAAVLEKVKRTVAVQVGREEWEWPEPPPEQVVRHVGKSEGFTHLYEPPRDTHLDRYLIGADVAEDKLDGDAHAAVVFDRLQRKPVALIHMRGDRRDYAMELVRVAKMYSVEDPRMYRSKSWCVLGWETNNTGSLHLIPDFRKYPRLLKRSNVDSKSAKERSTLGWYTSRATRPDIIEALRSWGKELAMHPERVPSEPIWDQMRTFVKNKSGRYEHASGCHDDIVMALGIALVMDMMMTMKGRGVLSVEAEKEKIAKRREHRRKNPPKKPPLAKNSYGKARLPTNFA